MIEIKVGQRWKTREGFVREVVEFDSTDLDYPWELDDGEWVSSDGRYYDKVEESACDLVELIYNPEEEGVTEVTKHSDSTITSLRDKIKEASEWLSSVDSQIEQKRQERIELVKQLNEFGLDVFSPTPNNS